MVVAFQGELGAYSEMAARAYFHEAVEVAPQPNFAAMFAAVEGGLRYANELVELIREHHLGNVDHWHSFLRRGPRCAIVKSLERQGDGSFHGVLPPAADPRPVSDNKFGRDYYDTRDFYVVAATVIGTWDSAEAPDSLIVIDTEGGDFHFKLGSDPLDALPDVEKSHRCFVAKIAPEDAQSVPHLDKVESVQVGFSKDGSTATDAAAS